MSILLRLQGAEKQGLPRLTDAEKQELRARLIERCDDVAISYWGEPLVRNRNEMRWGKGTGSLRLTLWPPHERGLWVDYDGSGGGDMIAMCRKENGGDWDRAMEDGCRRVGYHPPSWDQAFTYEQREARLRMLEADAKRRAEERARAEAAADAKAQKQGASAYANRIYRESIPIAGTLAERYIREHRFGGHDLPMPADLLFHPGVWSSDTKSKHPALVIGCGINGMLVRVQVVLLDPATGRKANVRSPKLTFGAGMGHAPASFDPWRTDEPQLRFLVEGPEDGIVLNACTGWRADASLGAGSLHKPRYPAGTRLVIVGDNGETGHREAQRAAAVHRGTCCDVTVIFPPPDVKDVNDLLLERGPDGVRQWIENAIAEAIEDAKKPKLPSLPAYYPAITEPLEEAKARQDDLILSFLANAARIADARRTLRRMRADELADKPELTRAQKATITKRLHREIAARFGFGQRIPKPPRTLLITGSQGTGKTSLSLQGIAAIEANVIVHKLAPTLKKCYEDLEAYEKVATERSMPGYVVLGRGQDDPRRPRKKMCPRFKVLKKVLEADISPRKVICPTCKLRNVCGTLRQEREIEELGNRAVFFMANEYLFLPTPAPEPDVVIVDERVTTEAISTIDVSVESLTQQKLMPYRGGDPGQAMEFGRSIDAIRQALMEPEALTALRTAGINRERLTDMRQLMDETLSVDINGEMEDETIDEAIEAVLDRDRKRALVLISAVAREIDMPRTTLSGVVFNSEKRMFGVSSLRQPVRTKNAAMLLLDGTGSPGLNHTLFGDLQHEEVRFERNAPVTGTIGRRYARQSITGRDADGKEIPSRVADAAKLRQDLGAIAARHPGFLLTAAKAAEEALINGNHLPASIETTHYGDLRGKNGWQDQPGVVSVGAQSLGIEDLSR